MTDTVPEAGSLKPDACPFCGPTIEGTWIGVETLNGNSAVNCFKCGTQGPWALSVEEAIAAWNRRAIEPVERGEAEHSDVLAEDGTVCVTQDQEAALQAILERMPDVPFGGLKSIPIYTLPAPAADSEVTKKIALINEVAGNIADIAAMRQAGDDADAIARLAVIAADAARIRRLCALLAARSPKPVKEGEE